jgi:hypothetical protein
MFNKKFTIISAELSTLGKFENDANTVNLTKFLIANELDFKRAEGCYKGTSEVSFIVDTPNVQVFNKLFKAAKNIFDQESILYVDEKSQGHLMFTKNYDMEHLGTFTQVNPKRIEELEAYTIVDNTLYAVL